MKLKKILLLTMIMMSFHLTFAGLSLEHIQFNPSIITSGDAVDILVQFKYDSSFLEDDRIGNPDYTFNVVLETDNDISKKYITLEDSLGDNLKGTIYSDLSYVKQYRVRVSPSAPKGDYQFKLTGKWFKNGVPEKIIQEEKFYLTVNKEGIILDLSSPTTNPSQIRPGDNAIEFSTILDNLGEKDAKSITVDLKLPQGFEHSFSNNNRVSIGRINSENSRELHFFLDIDEKIKSGVYPLNFTIHYLDLDNNKNTKNFELPLLIKPKANLIIEKQEGLGLTNEKGKLVVWIKNNGEVKAENVDVRIFKENSQPFEFEVRSNYIGEIKPNETAKAIFTFDILSDAEIKTHNFNLELRAKGDSDKGDNRIYTFSRSTSFEVMGEGKNNLFIFGLFGLVALVLVIIFKKRTSKK